VKHEKRKRRDRYGVSGLEFNCILRFKIRKEKNREIK